MQSFTRTRTRPRAQESGFTLLEALIGGSLMALALLGHTSSLFNAQKLGAEQTVRSAVLATQEQFMERLRSDDDFATLYERLMTIHQLSLRTPVEAKAWFVQRNAALGSGGELWSAEGEANPEIFGQIITSDYYERGLATSQISFAATEQDHVMLRDGRRAFTPATYHPAFSVPQRVNDFYVAVEVPGVPLDSSPYAYPVLREDAAGQGFGLPADLDGDGAIDSASHIATYRALPVVVTFRWRAASGGVEEMRLSSWLWGNR